MRATCRRGISLANKRGGRENCGHTPEVLAESLMSEPYCGKARVPPGRPRNGYHPEPKDRYRRVMRFIYVDSRGNEVEVASVEALAARIQLGAIVPETRLYDEAADLWAPAEAHPVYRQILREGVEPGQSMGRVSTGGEMPGDPGPTTTREDAKAASGRGDFNSERRPANPDPGAGRTHGNHGWDVGPGIRCRRHRRCPRASQHR